MERACSPVFHELREDFRKEEARPKACTRPEEVTYIYNI